MLIQPAAPIEQEIVAPAGVAYEIVENDEDADDDVVTLEFTVPIEPVQPERWSDAELFRVKAYGPAIIGQEMYDAVQRRIKDTGNGKLGPSLTLSADEHSRAVAEHQAKLAARATEAAQRVAAEKVARQQRYEAAIHSPFPTKPAA